MTLILRQFPHCGNTVRNTEDRNEKSGEKMQIKNREKMTDHKDKGDCTIGVWCL